MSDGWIKTNRGWIKRYGTPPSAVASSDFPCPRIISDAMPPAEHVNGQFYDSKAAFRAVTKAEGLIEVGNEKVVHTKPTPKAATTADIKAALAQAGIN